MTPGETENIDANALLKMRKDKVSLDYIIHRLGVKEMGPADYIRTKHEVREFLITGDEALAKAIVELAEKRRYEQHVRETDQIHRESRAEIAKEVAAGRGAEAMRESASRLGIVGKPKMIFGSLTKK